MKIFEILTPKKDYEIYYFVGVHISSALLIISLNSSTTLYGFGEISNENEDLEINPDGKNEDIRIFQIDYLSSCYYDKV